MRYMVMECHLSYAVVLDENGRFLNVANLQYEVGQMVTDIIEMQEPGQPVGAAKKTAHRWIASLAAVAACLALMVLPALHIRQAPYASVYMTINPEVRIDVNRNDTVVGLEGVNDDGSALIEQYNYKKKELDVVMDELVDRAIDMGFLHEGGQITLTLDAEDGEWVVSRGDALSTHLNEHLSEKLSVTIEVKDIAAEKHEVIIPVAPGKAISESGYGESAYGTSAYEASDSAGSPAAEASTAPGDRRDGDSPYDDGQTDYEERDTDGQSSYGAPDDGQSSYGNLEEGQSNYGPPDDDGQSSYHTEPDDGVSDYHAAPATDSQSNYDAPDNDSQSNYNAPDEDGQSSYDAPDDDEGQSHYDDSEDDQEDDQHSENDEDDD